MKYILATILFFITVKSHAQQKFVVDENATVRTVAGSFNAVHVSSSIHLVLTKGDEEIIAVSASDATIKENIKTEIEDGILKIYYKGMYRSSYNKRMNVYVSYKTLNEIKASDASNVLLADKLSTSSLYIKVSDASTFKGEIITDTLLVKISDASAVKLTGTAKECGIKCSDASTFSSCDFVATLADIIASDASSISITATAEINATARDASSISYKGTAIIKKSLSQDASSIRHVE